MPLAAGPLALTLHHTAPRYAVLRYAVQATCHTGYSAIMTAQLGRWAAVVLDASMMLNCFGEHRWLFFSLFERQLRVVRNPLTTLSPVALISFVVLSSPAYGGDATFAPAGPACRI